MLDNIKNEIPKYQDLMLPVLQYSKNGEVKISDVVQGISDDLNLSEEARSVLISSGSQSLITNRIHWAKTYLVKAGLLEGTRRGYFKITPDGEKVLAENPSYINNKTLSQFQSFQDFTKTKEDYNSEVIISQNVSQDSQLSPYDVIESAHADLETSLGAELLKVSEHLHQTFLSV